MAGRKFTRRVVAPKKPPDGDTRLIVAIEAQRRRVFQVSAIAACLGHALQDVCVPGTRAPELQSVTDVMIQLLDDVAAGLDSSVLKLQMHPAVADSCEA